MAGYLGGLFEKGYSIVPGNSYTLCSGKLGGSWSNQGWNTMLERFDVNFNGIVSASFNFPSDKAQANYVYVYDSSSNTLLREYSTSGYGPIDVELFENSYIVIKVVTSGSVNLSYSTFSYNVTFSISK